MNNIMNFKINKNNFLEIDSQLLGGHEWFNIDECSYNGNGEFTMVFNGDVEEQNATYEISAYYSLGDKTFSIDSVVTDDSTFTFTLDSMPSVGSILFDLVRISSGTLQFASSSIYYNIYGNDFSDVYTSYLVTDGGFDESTSTTWFNNAYNPVDGVNMADIGEAGNSWDVNLSGYVNIEAGQDYTLSFDVYGDDRTIIAGIGQSVDPYYNRTQTVTLSGTTQTIVMHLNASHEGTGETFGGDTSRVLFDMGAETGQVNIDNVSLTAGHTGTVNLGSSGDNTNDNTGGETVEQKSVTFQLDLSQYTPDITTETIKVFSDGSIDVEMNHIGNDIYQGTAQLGVGTYEYEFKIGGTSEDFSSSTINALGFSDDSTRRKLIVTNKDIILPAVQWESDYDALIPEGVTTVIYDYDHFSGFYRFKIEKNRTNGFDGMIKFDSYDTDNNTITYDKNHNWGVVITINEERDGNNLDTGTHSSDVWQLGGNNAQYNSLIGNELVNSWLFRLDNKNGDLQDIKLIELTSENDFLVEGTYNGKTLIESYESSSAGGNYYYDAKIYKKEPVIVDLADQIDLDVSLAEHDLPDYKTLGNLGDSFAITNTDGTETSAFSFNGVTLTVGDLSTLSDDYFDTLANGTVIPYTITATDSEGNISDGIGIYITISGVSTNDDNGNDDDGYDNDYDDDGYDDDDFEYGDTGGDAGATLDPPTVTFPNAVTNDGTVTVTMATGANSWEYSIDGGSSWTTGTGNTFILESGSGEARTYNEETIAIRNSDATDSSDSVTNSNSITIEPQILETYVGSSGRRYALWNHSGNDVTIGNEFVKIRNVGYDFLVKDLPNESAQFDGIALSNVMTDISNYTNPDALNGYELNLLKSYGEWASVYQNNGISNAVSNDDISSIKENGYNKNWFYLVEKTVFDYKIEIISDNQFTDQQYEGILEDSLLFYNDGDDSLPITNLALGDLFTDDSGEKKTITFKAGCIKSYKKLNSEFDFRFKLYVFIDSASINYFVTADNVEEFDINNTKTDIYVFNGSNDNNIAPTQFNDYITGSNEDDNFQGGDGNDIIFGNEGNDTIDGNDGNDIIDGGDGNDYIAGGEGNDIIDGSLGNDVIDGNEGNDVIDGGDGNDNIFGNEGDDDIDGNTGFDVIKGNEGDDTLTGTAGNNYVYIDDLENDVIDINDTSTIVNTIVFNKYGQIGNITNIDTSSNITTFNYGQWTISEATNGDNLAFEYADDLSSLVISSNSDFNNPTTIEISIENGKVFFYSDFHAIYDNIDNLISVLEIDSTYIQVLENDQGDYVYYLINGLDILANDNSTALTDQQVSNYYTSTMKLHVFTTDNIDHTLKLQDISFIVRDIADPVISGIPDNITVESTDGNSVQVTWTEPTASDNSEIDTFVSNYSPGDSFPVGTTTVTYTATDDTGNDSTASFTVTVTYTDTDPVITGIPENMTVQSPDGNNVSVTWTEPTASDNREIDTFVSNYSPGDSFPVGTTTVTYTATDDSGNDSTASFTITVIYTDTTPPGIPTLTFPTDSNNMVTVSLPEDAVTWEYSIDSGVNWNNNNNTEVEFQLPNGTYSIGQIQVRCNDASTNTSAVAMNDEEIATLHDVTINLNLEHFENLDYEPYNDLLTNSQIFVVTIDLDTGLATAVYQVTDKTITFNSIEYGNFLIPLFLLIVGNTTVVESLTPGYLIQLTQTIDHTFTAADFLVVNGNFQVNKLNIGVTNIGNFSGFNSHEFTIIPVTENIDEAGIYNNLDPSINSNKFIVDNVTYYPKSSDNVMTFIDEVNIIDYNGVTQNSEITNFSFKIDKPINFGEIFGVEVKFLENLPEGKYLFSADNISNGPYGNIREFIDDEFPNSNNLFLFEYKKNYDVVALKEGWNLIGASFTSLIYDGDSITIPSSLYEFNNNHTNAFSPVKILDANKGYWIKAKSAGTIELIKQD